MKCEYCKSDLSGNGSIEAYEDNFYHPYCLTKYKQETSFKENKERYPDLHDDLLHDNWILIELQECRKVWILIWSHDPESDYEYEEFDSLEKLMSYVKCYADDYRNRYWTPYFAVHELKSQRIKVKRSIEITYEDE